MNRPLVLAGVTLSAVVTLSGCGASKKAGTVAQTASPKVRHRTPAAATSAPRATATAAGTVRVGGFCKATGTVGKATTGGWARCEKRSGDKRARWYAQPAKGGARAGAYCSRTGATATSSTGTKLTCTKKSGETRPRWRAK
jgi:hypothetical protein